MHFKICLNINHFFPLFVACSVFRAFCASRILFLLALYLHTSSDKKLFFSMSIFVLIFNQILNTYRHESSNVTIGFYRCIRRTNRVLLLSCCSTYIRHATKSLWNCDFWFGVATIGRVVFDVRGRFNKNTTGVTGFDFDLEKHKSGLYARQNVHGRVRLMHR